MTQTMPISPLFADLALRGWFPLWLAVTLGIASAIGIALLYFKESGRLPVFTRIFLAASRIAILGTVLFLVLRPTIVRQRTDDRPRPVVLLVDESQSMQTRDPRNNFAERWRVGMAFNHVPGDKAIPTNGSVGDIPADVPEKPSRTELVKAALIHPRWKLIDRLKDLGPLQPAGFGGRRIAKDARDAKWVESIGDGETRTAIADSILDLLSRDDADRPAAVVLMTDGRENSGKQSLEDLGRECARAGVPLHIYGVGSSSYGTLQLRDVAVADTLFVEDTVAVPVRYRVRGYQAGSVEITVKLNGNEVARKMVEVKEGEDIRELLAFVPQQKDVQPGKQELTTSIRMSAGNELISDDLTKSVRVVDRKVKVLVLDSEPRWDFKFLQRALLRDRRVEATFYLANADSAAMRAGPPFIFGFPGTRQELFAYDLIVLGDLPASAMAPDQREFLRDFVAEGGGLIHIAGRQHAPAWFVNTPLADLLPVEVQPVRFAIDSAAAAVPFRPQPTAAGLRSPLLSLDDDPVENVRTWQTLPEIYWFYPSTKLKPASDSLLVHPEQKTPDGKPMPLLAGHYYGKGYVLFAAFDETWRWRFNAADQFFGRFWSQAVYAAGVPRTLGTKLTQLSLDTADPLVGRTGQIYARLFSPDLRPLTADRIEARLERLDAAAEDPNRIRSVELKAVPGQPGDYLASLPFNRVGKFAFKVDAGADAASLEYRVGLPADHELAPGGMAEEDLRRLAEATGGTFYREEDLHAMPTTVKPQTYPITLREEILLWNRWALFLLIGLFTLEWFFRKFNGLS